MSAETSAAPGRFTRWRLQFRAWRGTRPFWAGLFMMIGGVPIMYFPYAHLTIGQLTVRMSTTAGAGSLIIGVLLVVLGISLWFQKHIRTFAGVAAILLALVSLPVSNFGGFVVGFLFGMIGGAMAIAWVPGTPPEPQAEQSTDGQGGAPESAVTDLTKADGATAHFEAGGGPEEPNDMSETSPANGANGRHSVG
ncbi:DUF6114 domain-containing protein [Streptomyces sp. NBC_00582]|uniref:DUF6114 domain-containing protein n=1 Tax=Streptomyces sp. NBC_00582 TaxID=2975783 RepID=UPI0010644A88|nr:DUF6114 domain-containing protein [Streptomyces sp. NBC_00582]WUB61899.1 DUF6114 domain-containing protein [Streptomyces sp. NBC_00582]